MKDRKPVSAMAAMPPGESAPVGAADAVAWLRRIGMPAGARLEVDSRQVQQGSVFLAFPGHVGDGRDFIAQAVTAGAAAVLYESAGFEPETLAGYGVPCQAIPDLHRHAGRIAAEWYGSQAGAQAVDRLLTIAVTGTNGKTTCTQWIAQALSVRAPVIVAGTLGIGCWRRGQRNALIAVPGGNTTPGAVWLHGQVAALCRDMSEPAAGALVLEASSIGIEQSRLSGLAVDIAVHTNLSRDHLDHHGDLASYEAAKTALFDRPELHAAVVNRDDAMGQRLMARFAQPAAYRRPDFRVYAYTCAPEPDAKPTGGESREGSVPQAPGLELLRASDVRFTGNGMQFLLQSAQGSGYVRVAAVGRFNVSNVLAVAACLLAADLSFSQMMLQLAALAAVPGRMQPFGGEATPLALVDYAHTPDALLQALGAARDAAVQRRGRLWCVFGCGGDRDRGKRPQMGAVAAMHADEVVLTSDNPRTEEPQHILDDIQAGIPAVQQGGRTHGLHRMTDRASAIVWALRNAARSDVVLVAGKGHEDYQEIRGVRLPFRDADHVALGLAARATMKGGA